MTDHKQDDARSSKPAAERSKARKPRSMFDPERAYKPIELSDVVSGQFDEEEATPDEAPDLGKRVLAAWPRQMAPVLTTRFATRYGELAFFSMFSTFGTPQDITLASLRVEHVCPADDLIRAVIAAQVR